MRFSVVVEDGGCPALRVVAFGTMRLLVFGQELTVVGVLMAGFTERGRALESGFRIRGGLVAIDAGDGAMCSEQGEFCF